MVADPQRSPVGPIAALDSAVLAGGEYEPFLSPREHTEFLQFRTPRRRGEWLAARLASKFLFLTGDSGMLSASDLQRFPAETYRSVEVTRDDQTRFGIPQVRRGNACRDVAISHTDGVACALLGDGETIALDIEQVEPRGAVFYRGNFTARERAWVEECSGNRGLNPHWTFTLLWSIKECLLKTPQYSDFSVWGMPSIDIRILSGEGDLPRVQSAMESFGDFVFLTIEAASAKGTNRWRVAVSGWQDRVITAIRGADRRTV